ncbi:HAMP domain-containing histidine kinase [Yinghuangia sp. ASG 101]|uniref:HAMP domain-containing sensor histidine kinase n=1 Tax=Yinghuangia sp. ASG 101 TaxID=2896848 RepID=UPI001E551192|nr:HAMP domain-containing sensor histidine kinase [Yinghuangia sp. ASG 101]UGQ13716.1 HAMP domain-containing histidine kinase [Yinghuangia sp. ASG 101]
MRRLPLRARLALMTAVAVAVAVAAASTACWFLTRQQLMSQMDQTLRESDTGQFAVHLFDNGTCEFASGLGGPVPEVFRRGLESFQVVLPNGNTCTAMGDVAYPTTAADIEVAQGTRRDTIHTVTADDGTRMRVITRRPPRPPNAPGPKEFAVSIARPLTEIDDSLDNLALLLLAVSGVGILGAATTGVLVARSALKPVDRFTDVVEHIARTEDLDLSLPVEGKDEIARLSRSFNAMTGALKASRERQTALIADAGHELRTPLTSLRTNTDLLLMSEEQGRPLPDTDKQRLLRNVRAQLRELSGLVGNLLDLARPDPARNAPVRGVVPWHTVVEHAVERAKLRGQDVAFAVHLEPWHVRGDDQELERAVLNLLDNAVKFGPPDGTIDVVLHEGELTVRDHGPGIDPADAPHVFDRFWRSASARALPGSGLGLAIVARTVHESGGTVGLEPAPGGGTLARVRLPGTRNAPGAPTPP